MEEFKESTRRAFKQCRSDIDSLKFENQRLKDQLETIQNTNSQLSNTISSLTSELKGIKIALDYIKNFNEVSPNQNSHFSQTSQQTITNQEQATLSSQPQNVLPPQPMYQAPVTQQPQIQTDPYEALLAFKAKANKRDMLKQKMASMIADNGMNLAELKFMFVDHHRYCSKATFYNYLKELEANGTLVQERLNGKTHVYRSETLSNNSEINEINIR